MKILNTKTIENEKELNPKQEYTGITLISLVITIVSSADNKPRTK